MTELGRLPGDTVPDRRWRVVIDGDVYRLECTAMVPGGWKEVFEEPDLVTIRKRAAWLGLRIDAEVAMPDRHQAAA